MKPIYPLALALLSAISAIAQQKPVVKWGDDFKLKKGTSDISVIASDKSGVYLEEQHLVAKEFYFVTARMGRSATLIKTTPNLTLAYEHNYDKELKTKEFEMFKPLGDELFIFATAFNKETKKNDLFVAKVEKSSGDISGDWKLINSFDMANRSDYARYKLRYNVDSSRIIIVSSIRGKENTAFKVQEIDSKLNISEGVTIRNEFESNAYQLKNIIYTLNRKIILIGGIYELEEGKKDKDKNYIFSHYKIRVYDEKGKQESEVNTDNKGKFLTSTDLFQENNKDLVLVAFYSNEKKSEKVDGLLIQRIDISNGKTISSNDKAITESMFANDNDVAADDDDDDDEDKSSKKSNKTDIAAASLGRNVEFRKMFFTSDGGLLILAEAFKSYTYTTSYNSPGVNNSPGTERTSSVTTYLSGDIVMVKVAASGEVSWIQTLPKKQRERISLRGVSMTSGWGAGMTMYSSSGMPYYSGFGAIKTGKNISLFMNDNPKNADVTKAGQRVKMAAALSKSDCFLINVDEATGNVTRSRLFNNKEIPTSMPKVVVTIGNDQYMVGRSDKNVWKNRIVVGKITL